MQKQPRKFTSSESEEEDDYTPEIPFYKSAVFNKQTKEIAPKLKRKPQLEGSAEEIEQQDLCLQPKMADRNDSEAHLLRRQLVTGVKLSSRPLTGVYRYNLKSPQPVKRKRHDPVTLFQQTSKAWKKDRFLTNRADNKEGRKLDLDKRNKDLKMAQCFDTLHV